MVGRAAGHLHGHPEPDVADEHERHGVRHPPGWRRGHAGRPAGGRSPDPGRDHPVPGRRLRQPHDRPLAVTPRAGERLGELVALLGSEDRSGPPSPERVEGAVQLIGRPGLPGNRPGEQAVNKKPALIAALVGAVLSVVLVVALITPKAGQVRAKQKEIVTAQQDQASLQAQLEQLQAAAKDAPKDRKRLSVLKAQVPPTADLPGLIRLLNTTADRSGVDFQTVSPGQPSASGTYSVIPVQVTVVGGFFAVDQYLYLLETLPRVSKVISVVLAPGPSGAPQLSMNITADFFTTDTSAGPGSVPGGNQPVAPAPSPAPTTTPGG
ncbi:MAG: hypothetical protein E6G40_04365 [Actinobacteria bacterium]|nr:MAG: hypothetical protein E6G40_04365 [Actinomycetota bacterium]